ncbi:hypothetical protein CAPTEDRAFT_210736 [Capitella teleta]|uniref:Syntaxin N-terminal domain-containing protein n=1 Tax=Capitella teleta TaxID=283909 RepID=R7TM07_CAPTE|nr:hypothetical protein CAPTEDRAFT_210736 [Capitella teleta]|eukprot:ELT94838.1 hypothetical protein CAPTEDRAFT_210736 [Capitella teleta]
MSSGNPTYGSTSATREGDFASHGSRQPSGSIYNELIDKIKGNIFVIENNASLLVNCNKQIGTNADSRDLRKKIQTSEQKTKEIISETIDALKQVKASFSAQSKTQKLQYGRLMNEFEEAVKSYNDQQMIVVERVRSARPLVDARTIVIIEHEDDDEGASLLDREARRVQMQENEGSEDAELDFLLEREEEMRILERNTLELNQIFHELHRIVHEQEAVIGERGFGKSSCNLRVLLQIASRATWRQRAIMWCEGSSSWRNAIILRKQKYLKRKGKRVAIGMHMKSSLDISSNFIVRV